MRFENNCFLPAADSSDLYAAEKGTEVISGGFVVVVVIPPRALTELSHYR